MPRKKKKPYGPFITFVGLKDPDIFNYVNRTKYDPPYIPEQEDLPELDSDIAIDGSAFDTADISSDGDFEISSDISIGDAGGESAGGMGESFSRKQLRQLIENKYNRRYNWPLYTNEQLYHIYKQR